jgi:hypothetical protein
LALLDTVLAQCPEPGFDCRLDAGGWDGLRDGHDLDVRRISSDPRRCLSDALEDPAARTFQRRLLHQPSLAKCAHRAH